MKEAVIFFSLVMVCSGCSIVTSGPKASTATLPRELQLKIGMSRAEVAAVMDRAVTVGYEIDPATGAAKPIEAPSLFSTELLTKGNKTYQIDKYITRDDNGIAVTVEDLLYPAVFEHGLLVARGREGLEQLMNR